MSEREYRTAKHVLEKHDFATFKATNKGTVARLLDTRVFDVNLEPSDGQRDRCLSNNRRATDGQPTTNKKGKKKKKDRLKTGDFGNRLPSSAKEVFAYGRNSGCEVEVILRFIRYNNLNGWQVNNWRGALSGFRLHIEEYLGEVSDVPRGWVPEIIVPPEMESSGHEGKQGQMTTG